MIKVLFNEVLVDFIKNKIKKYLFDTLKNYIDSECIIVFDGENSELKAFYEYITEKNIKYKWIGMNGTVSWEHRSVAVIVNLNH